MDKIYVCLEDLWPYVQKEYEKAKDRNDLKGQQWCNYFMQLITCADHQRISVEEKENA
jgi:hypothetical protein